MLTVHLIESDAADALTLRLLGDLLAAGACDGAVRVIGPRWLARKVERAGLAIDQAINTSGSRFSDGRAMRAASRGFDCVHTWSLRGATLAAIACGRMPQRMTLTAAPQSSPGLITRRLIHRAGVTGWCIGAGVRGAMITAGFDSESLTPIAPTVDPGHIICDARSMTRMRLGVSDHNMKLALLVGDSPGAMDVLRAVLAAGLVDETGRSLRVAISPNFPGLRRAMRAVDAEQRGERVIITHRADKPWQLVGACDLAIAVGGGLSTAWAMAAGLPIAAQQQPSVIDLLQHDHNALLAPADSAGELARRIRRLIDEPDTAADLGRAAAETARTELYPSASRLAG